MGGSYVEIPSLYCSTTIEDLGYVIFIANLPKGTIVEALLASTTHGSLTSDNRTYNSNITVIGKGSKTNYKIYKLTADGNIAATNILNIKIPVPEE